MDLTEIWLARRKEFPLISDKAVKFLFVFSTPYLCEYVLSSMIYIKSKYMNRLSTDSDLRLKLTKTESDKRTLFS
jgi:hypothetical protein